MKFTLDNANAVLAVTARLPGEVRLGGRALRHSFVVHGGSLMEDWAVVDVAGLAAALEAVLARQPDILVLGTGEHQVFPPAEVVAMVAGRGVGFEVMDNGAACRTYNLLLAEGRNVALAVIL